VATVVVDAVSLGDRLKQRREELGLSQAQAARELDVARTAYRLWEMEAAHPAPDRWRLIARWLGVSVTTMLLADELITEVEAAESGLTEAQFGRSGKDWDATGAAQLGDFFQQGRALIQNGLDSGSISDQQADELAMVLDRLEAERQQALSVGWAEGELRKAFPAAPETVDAARDAVSLLAVDIPSDVLASARLLTSELVAHSVEHGPPAPARIGLFVAVAREVIRVEVSDASAAPPSRDGHDGLSLLDSLASRWDTSREGYGNVTWFELDLPVPGV
jgi:transcriptional regulator with XRE-family HTH domain